MRDLEKFVAGLHDYIGKALAPLAAKMQEFDQHLANYATLVSGIFDKHLERITALEAREPIHGKDADEESIVARIQAAWEAKFDSVMSDFSALLPPPGLSADEVKAIALASIPDVPSLVADQVARLPAPPQGEKGEDGRSFTLEEVTELVQRAVAGEREKWELTVESSLAKWALDFERRAQDTLQRACDRIPAPKDGADGVGWDDMRIEHDGERKFALVFTKGDKVRRDEFSLPVVLDRGFWERGKAYAAGDGVTSKGCFWIAKADTDQAPGESDDWRKAVSKGRDARVALPAARPSGPVKLGTPE